MNPTTILRSFFRRRILLLLFAFGYLVPTLALHLLGYIWQLVSPTWDWPKGLTDFLSACISGFLSPVFAIVFGMSVAHNSKKQIGYVLLGLIALITIITNTGIFSHHATNTSYSILSICCTALALWLFYQRLQQMEPDDSYPHNLLYNTTAALANKPQYPTGGATTIMQILSLKGFDSNGEPKIRIMANGSIYVAFSAMPPLNKQRRPIIMPVFDDFTAALQKAVNVTVEHQNNNCFFIPHPEKDTAYQLKYYLATFWENEKQA
ncbi:hypothetical protein ACFGVR_10445 [Mucilaginibacter sp. AW1-3]